MLEIAMVFLSLLTSPERNEVDCLAKAIYHEARGEDYLGQIGVASVVLNRKKSKDFPKNVCDVVYQPRQFSYMSTARFNFKSPEWSKAVEVSVLTYTGLYKDPTHGALFYYNPKKAKKPKVFGSFLRRIGNHDYHQG